MLLLRPLNYLKSIVLCFAFLFSIPQTFSQPAFCASGTEETKDSLLKRFKENFHQKMKAHYDKLVKEKAISESRKMYYLKKYENPEIKVCPNPHSTSQKIVYIEYEKNWWGSLYFTVVKDDKVLKWVPIETYGAVTESVRWDDEKTFFYKDSTHMGTKTQNTCLIQDSSVKCKKTK